MRHGLLRALVRIAALADQGKVRFTVKAFHELAGLGLDASDACEILSSLTMREFACRKRSEPTDEWLYVFMPRVAGTVLYVKLIARTDCVIISFHEAVSEPEEDRA